MINQCYLHLGSNKDNPLIHLLRAFDLIEVQIGKIVVYSKFYKTEAWGKKDQNDFINVALNVSTKISIANILQATQKIEQQIGRNQHIVWGPRDIDIDILYFNRERYKTDILEIPHPLISQRNFVLTPLLEIATDFIDPLHQKTIEELYLASRDKCKVTLL